MTKHWPMILLLVIPPSALADEQGKFVIEFQKNKTVFVTKTSYPGNFGGIEVADAICQAEADDATSIVPGGTYLAWLSEGDISPDVRFTKATVPYVLADGTVIAEDYADLTDGSLIHQINMEPAGQSIGILYTWTGTKSDGTSAGDWLTCKGWKAEPIGRFHGMGGRTERTDGIWSSRAARVGCGRQHRLWCFQQ